MGSDDETCREPEPGGGHEAVGPAVIDRDLYCRNCALNLRGYPRDSACPQCGARVHVEAAGATIRGEVGWDLACVRCAYTLRGLDRSGACPECALLVLDSLRPRGFAAASPDVLRRICMCLTAEAWCAGIWVSAALLGIITASVLTGATVRGAASLYPGTIFLLVPIAMLASSVAWVLLTRAIGRCPLRAGDRPRSLGVARSGALIAACGILGYALFAALDSMFSMRTSGAAFAVTGAFLSLGLFLLSFVGLCLKHFGGILVLRWIGTTQRNASIVRRSGFVMVLSIIVCAAIVLSIFVLPMIFGMSSAFPGQGSGSSQSAISRFLLAMGITAGLCGLGFLVLAVAYIGLLRRCRQELAEHRWRIEQAMAAAQGG